MRDSPSGWAQSPRLLAGTLLEAKDSPLVHFISPKDSDLWFWHLGQPVPCRAMLPGLQAQNSQAPGWGGVANGHSRHCPYPERKEDSRGRKRPGTSG